MRPAGGKSAVQQGLFGWCAGELREHKAPLFENLSWASSTSFTAHESVPGPGEVGRNHPSHMNVLLIENHTAHSLGIGFPQVLGEATKEAGIRRERRNRLIVGRMLGVIASPQ